jgi:hypothetical protein
VIKALCILCKTCRAECKSLCDTIGGLVMQHKEEGSSELHKSSVLCGVRVLRLCACNRVTEDYK